VAVCSLAIRIFNEWLPRAQAKLQPGQNPLPFGRSVARDAYRSAGRLDRAVPLAKEAVAEARRLYDSDDLRLADALAPLGYMLLRVQQPAEAEKELRESLAIREKKEPDAWATFRDKSLIGHALLDQNKHSEAEPLLTQGYNGLEERKAKIPAPVQPAYLGEALQRLVRLYDRWGKPEQADPWRKKLEAHKLKTRPESPSLKQEKKE